MTPEPIAMVDLRAQWRRARSAALDAVERVGESGWFVLGPEVAAFEEELARACGLRRAVATGNGMDAIEIALRAAGLQPGQRVLTTPLSAFATTLAIVRAGGVPVFADVDESGLLDLGLAGEVLAGSTPIRALVPVHLYGHALDLAALRALRDAYELVVVEDCAQAIGARSAGQAVGTVSELAATSFYPTKNLGAFGDGGAVLTDDDARAATARALRDYGQRDKYEHELLGLNSRLDELHAAILRSALLPSLAADTKRRAAIAERYRAGLDEARVQVPPAPPGSSSVWHLFPVLVDAPGARAPFREALRRQGIQTAIHYPFAIPDQAALDGLGAEALTELDRARSFAAREVSLPLHPFLADADVDRVVAAVNAWR